MKTLKAKRRAKDDFVVALLGNPNVGKSTVFNALTHLNQHTGNWPGKTVTCAQGYFKTKKRGYTMVDLPGTYSLLANSGDEEAARDFVLFGGADIVAVVCDATALKRNLNLVLQAMEMHKNVIVLVNLIDEAKRKHIVLDLPELSRRLRVPVIGVCAHKKRTLNAFKEALDAYVMRETASEPIRYQKEIERALARVDAAAERYLGGRLSARWLNLRLLEEDEALQILVENDMGKGVLLDDDYARQLALAKRGLRLEGVDAARYKDMVVCAINDKAERLCAGVVRVSKKAHDFDRRVDAWLTGRVIAFPVMLVLLALIFYITMVGANYPSAWLSGALLSLEPKLSMLLMGLGVPAVIIDALVMGVYRTLSWVVSVMLPPMAIFFPLFTLLEDCGYLPRIAYNLDKPFMRCKACGKQALCMCMGLGCNAVGVTGCRIISAPRERLLAILTNTFMPCNGRFPTLILLITLFFSGAALGGAAMMAGFILLSVGVTLLITRLLSATLLKGVPSFFTLEMPPFRKPQLMRVLVRSVLDRTLFVLGRAVAVAAPAGLIIFALSNINMGGQSLLSGITAFLDPFARVFGLDGVILAAFILGFPANEIVLPIIIMAYTAQGALVEMESMPMLFALLKTQGWTWVTALCTMLFSIFHFPCSTTLITIKKETGSKLWTLVAFLLPTIVGLVICLFVKTMAGLFFGL